MKRILVEAIKNSTEIMFHNFYITLVTCDMEYTLRNCTYDDVFYI